ncbi:hypothetical protein B0T11DRAFT_224812 [Plectosphaerella cucumerina]|uniref:Fungal N-terminal domain-containing protein n=1 Tax=Plectosphaerella cucumerina TaxID=40658 RepID=A0A8K0T3X9_9PEZI|nr:hypothetical protein B0T11DRAFT_233576 [Plectosphaerella cucumerina]KAH7363595.1 hypothetical protein B0T11DRAFT_224812 [Plectosphaerella cucumerina]
MDPFSITAGVVGIVGPTLHYVRILVKDLQNIADAPDAVKALTHDLQSLDLALASVQAVTDPQWKSLGDAVTAQSEAAITSCKVSCERFKTSLDHWTRHSTDGTLSWRDRATLGVFRQGHIKSMSEQLQNCRITLTSVASVATLHSSLQQPQAAEEIKTMILKNQTAVGDAIAAINDRSVEAGARLGELTLTEPDEGETDADQFSATRQVAMEKKALDETRMVLEGLLSVIQTAAANAQAGQGSRVTFGSHNSGQQVGVNSGTITATFGGKV